MAVMRNSLIFGGVNSADFGVFISGEGRFNAPKRAVTIVSVPGRNGDVLIDEGRYENIEVTYPGYVVGLGMEDFEAKLSGFRNALCSQIGYQRLTDTINSDEYRMAAIPNGIEFKPVMYNTVAKFDIVFNCKPQRYLLSGEEEVTVASGGKLINPTLHEASPLLAVNGYGEININGESITLANETVGNVEILPNTAIPKTSLGGSKKVYPALNMLNVGDQISVGDIEFNFTLEISDGIVWNSSYWTDDGGSGTLSTLFTSASMGSDTLAKCMIRVSGLTFNKSSSPNLLIKHDATLTVTHGTGTSSHAFTASIRVYYKNANYITVELSINTGSYMTEYSGYVDGMTGASSMPVLGNPTYIDCDLGEAFKYSGGSPVSLNAYIDLGPDLPKLTPGENTITKSNTITELKITPRWWQI